MLLVMTDMVLRIMSYMCMHAYEICNFINVRVLKILISNLCTDFMNP